MMELVVTVFSAAFFVTIIRTTTPLLLATLGGLIADLSGALNVALEGMMLIGAIAGFAAAAESGYGVAVGLPAGALAGVATAMIFAFFALPALPPLQWSAE